MEPHPFDHVAAVGHCPSGTLPSEGPGHRFEEPDVVRQALAENAHAAPELGRTSYGRAQSQVVLPVHERCRKTAQCPVNPGIGRGQVEARASVASSWAAFSTATSMRWTRSPAQA
jgi:hypothetical protein